MQEDLRYLPQSVLSELLFQNTKSLIKLYSWFIELLISINTIEKQNNIQAFQNNNISRIYDALC